VKKWSLQARGQGGLFGINGQGLPVATSPVAGIAAQNPQWGPLAPTVEMLLDRHFRLLYIHMVMMLI
jgi:hypothetical protein